MPEGAWRLSREAPADEHGPELISVERLFAEGFVAGQSCLIITSDEAKQLILALMNYLKIAQVEAQ